MTLTFQPMCPALTACGGDVVGSWEYNAGCVSTDALFTQAKSLCPTITFSSMTGDSRGSVIFTNAMVARAINTNISGVANIPASCTAVITCAQIQSGLATAAKTASCVNGIAGGCVCDFTFQAITSGVVPYTKAANQFTTDPGTGQTKTYDYCRTGTPAAPVFTYKELGQQPRDPGIFTMQKK